MLKINALRCKKCKDIIYSRAVHDMHFCSCGAIAIDGGFDYMRILGNAEDMESVTVKIDVTKDKLYQDWNFRKDKFGLIKQPKTNAKS